MTPINTRKGQVNPHSPYDATHRAGKQQLAAPQQTIPNGMLPGDGYEAPKVPTPPPPPYNQVIGQLRSSLTKFDKELKSKVGLKAAKGAAGGTLIGSAIFGGI